jgi:hypothetical protein
VFEVRSGTGETDVFIGGDTTDPSKRTRIPTFMSPTGVLGPRIIRFNITYWFGDSPRPLTSR